MAETDLRLLLKQMQPELGGEYAFCVVDSLARFTGEPLATFREREGLTIVVPQNEADAAGLQYDYVGRLITLNVNSSLVAVGFLARIAGRLAAVGISLNAFSPVHHDHLFVRPEDADRAMEILETISREAEAERLEIGGIIETALYAADLDRAESFYTEILGLKLYLKESERHLFFRCGRGMLLIFNPEVTKQSGAELPPHGASGAGHIAFAVRDPDLEGWRARLLQNQTQIESELSWPSGGRSIYFRDPAGNSVELTTTATWQIKEQSLFI